MLNILTIELRAQFVQKSSRKLLKGVTFELIFHSEFSIAVMVTTRWGTTRLVNKILFLWHVKQLEA